jgi:NADP-dependent 3-hydroxy acid dehydrogenase YdfG
LFLTYFSSSERLRHGSRGACIETTLGCVAAPSARSRATIISPGVVATELPNTIPDTDVLPRIQKPYAEVAIPAGSCARAVVFAIAQPEDVGVNEILFRPTRQEY